MCVACDVCGTRCVWHVVCVWGGYVVCGTWHVWRVMCVVCGTRRVRRVMCVWHVMCV